MQPQFQSSFIPKGASAPASSISTVSPLGVSTAPSKNYSLLGILGGWTFTIAILLTAGLFGYKWYLNRQINQMSTDLSTAGQTLETDSITDLTRLNARLTSTRGLIMSHVILSPFFDFLEQNTLQNVRFSSFSFTTDAAASKVTMKGSARGYSAVALQSKQFNDATVDDKPAFTDVSFSDLSLDEKGNVTFNVTATVNASLLSYAREFPTVTPTPTTPAAVATTTATSTAGTVTTPATTTAATSTVTSASGGTSCKANDFTCIVNASKSCSLATMTATASSTTTRFDVLGKSGAECHSRTIYIQASADLEGKINDCTSATSDLTGYLTVMQKGASSTAATQFLANKCKLVSA